MNCVAGIHGQLTRVSTQDPLITRCRSLQLNARQPTMDSI